MRQRLHTFIHFEQICVVKRYHMPISTQNYHRLFMNKSSMSISCARLLSDHLSFLLVIDNFRQIELAFLIPGLLAHWVQAESQSLWSWRMASLWLSSIKATFDIMQQPFLSVQKLSIFFLLNNRHSSLKIPNCGLNTLLL